MKKSNHIALFFDSAISLVACFCGSCAAFSFLGENGTTLIIASIGCAVALSKLWLIFIGKAHSDKADYSAYKSQFVFRSCEQNTKLVYDAFSNRYECSLCDNSILTSKCKIIVLLRHEPLSCQAAIDLALSYTDKKMLIITCSTEKGALECARRVCESIEIIELNTLCEWLGKLKSLPPLPNKPPLKLRLKLICKEIMRPENSKRLFSCAVMIASLSLFSNFRVYFLACGALLLCLSLAIRIFAMRNNESIT